MDVAKKYLHAFEGATKISTSGYPRNYTAKTVNISPLPDDDLLFYFEAIHTEVPPLTFTATQHRNIHGSTLIDDFSKSNFLLKLIRLSERKAYPSILMSMEVKICYFDGSLFEEYEPRHGIKIYQEDSVTFDSVINHAFVRTRFGHGNSDHSNKMLSGPLILKFKMFFSGEVPKPDINCKTKEVSSIFFKNLKSVYDSGAFNDFVFVVGDKSFPVHKVILAANSPVFMKMVSQDFLESKTNSVTLTDVTPENFEMFLKYLYSGEIEDKSWSSVRELYGLADKYDVSTLKKDCFEIAVSLMDINLVCDILQVAYTYEDSDLRKAAKEFAVKHIKELILREDWKDLVATNPLIGYEVVVNSITA